MLVFKLNLKNQDKIISLLIKRVFPFGRPDILQRHAFAATGRPKQGYNPIVGLKGICK